MKIWIALTFVVALLCAAPARACDPAATRGEPEALPALWREALEALVVATRDASQPWGCPGGTLELAVHDEGARLMMHRGDGAELTRAIADPADVMPVGKAMLARAEAVPPPAQPPAVIPPSYFPDTVEPELAPRAYVDALGQLRYLGNSRVMTLGPAIRGELPFGPWSASLFLRYGVLVAELAAPINELGVSELTVGGGVSYVPIDDPVRLSFGLFGGLSVVDMESDDTSQPVGREDVESGAVDGRVGTEVRMSFPVVSFVRGVLALDLELSPATLGNPERRLDPLLPRMPSYTVGANVGLEAAIP